MNTTHLLNIVEAVTAYAAVHDFAGYSKYDGLNSPIVRALSLNNRWLRLLLTQIVMRSPVNLRSLLLVKTSRNPKGIALFARAYLLLYQTTGHERYKALAEEMLTWLTQHHANGKNEFSGHCWGYNFAWQSPLFYAPAYFPNITVTAFAGEAFLVGYSILKAPQYLDIACSAADYIVQDLPVLYETGTQKCLGYVTAPVTEKVINVNSMAAAFLAKVYSATQDTRYKDQAIKLVNFVVDNAIDDNRWTYTTNSDRSFIDNYHTGGILDALLETMEHLDYWAWQATLEHAVEYYQHALFTQVGAPKYRHNREFPYDIHGAAQGIITFAKMSRRNSKHLAFAERVFDWTLHNLYSGQGYFFYQRTRWHTKKFTLMRWCNAWMLYAMGELLTPGVKNT